VQQYRALSASPQNSGITATPKNQYKPKLNLKLVLDYGYPVEHIEQFVTVKMGSSSKEEFYRSLANLTALINYVWRNWVTPLFHSLNCILVLTIQSTLRKT